METQNDALLKDIPSRYTVLRQLGAGGVGVVYAAHDSYLNKDVAIKMMHTPSSDLAHLSRFQREAKLASSLNHPNVVTVLDFGVTDSGKPYMVMDYVDGESLDRLLKREKRLSVDYCIPIFIQICQGLAHAHKRGVLHRDLKPHNIILTRSNDLPLVKIVDFGLARPADPGADATLTRAGAVIGTPLYLSPEQASLTELDQRTDIYSMGCLMFEALTGDVPIRGETALETITLKSQKRAPSLNSRGLEFPVELSLVVNRCLETDPNNRFQTMEDLKAVLCMVQNECDEGADITRIIAATPRSVASRFSRKWAILALFFIAVSFPLSNYLKTKPQSPTKARTASAKMGPKPTTRKPAPGSTEAKAYRLCGIDYRESLNSKVAKMERYIFEHPDSFNYDIYNELRQDYEGLGNTRRSMECFDTIFKNVPYDQYSMSVLSEWHFESHRYRKGIATLIRIQNAYPDLKYLKAASSLGIADAQLVLYKPEQARPYYEELASETDPDLNEYKKIAVKGLAELNNLKR